MATPLSSPRRSILIPLIVIIASALGLVACGTAEVIVDSSTTTNDGGGGGGVEQPDAGESADASCGVCIDEDGADCRLFACDNGVCVSSPHPDGAPCTTPKGQHAQCASGVCTVCMCPPDDPEDCLRPHCPDLELPCAYQPLMEGTACMTKGAQGSCDASGGCTPLP